MKASEPVITIEKKKGHPLRLVRPSSAQFFKFFYFFDSQEEMLLTAATGAYQPSNTCLSTAFGALYLSD